MKNNKSLPLALALALLACISGCITITQTTAPTAPAPTDTKREALPATVPDTGGYGLIEREAQVRQKIADISGALHAAPVAPAQYATIRPDQQPLQDNPTAANFEFYSQKGGTPLRRANLDSVGRQYRPSIITLDSALSGPHVQGFFFDGDASVNVFQDWDGRQMQFYGPAAPSPSIFNKSDTVQEPNRNVWYKNSLNFLAYNTGSEWNEESQVVISQGTDSTENQILNFDNSQDQIELGKPRLNVHGNSVAAGESYDFTLGVGVLQFTGISSNPDRFIRLLSRDTTADRQAYLGLGQNDGGDITSYAILSAYDANAPNFTLNYFQVDTNGLKLQTRGSVGDPGDVLFSNGAYTYWRIPAAVYDTAAQTAAMRGENGFTIGDLGDAAGGLGIQATAGQINLGDVFGAFSTFVQVNPGGAAVTAKAPQTFEAGDLDAAVFGAGLAVGGSGVDLGDVYGSGNTKLSMDLANNIASLGDVSGHLDGAAFEVNNNTAGTSVSMGYLYGSFSNSVKVDTSTVALNVSRAGGKTSGLTLGEQGDEQLLYQGTFSVNAGGLGSGGTAMAYAADYGGTAGSAYGTLSIPDWGNVQEHYPDAVVSSGQLSYNLAADRYDAVEANRSLVAFVSGGTATPSEVNTYIVIDTSATTTTINLNYTPGTLLDGASYTDPLTTVREITNWGSGAATVQTNQSWLFKTSTTSAATLTIGAGETYRLLWRSNATPANARFYAIKIQ